MDKILLTTMPKYDDGTEYLSYYASLISKKASELNIIKKDFKGKEVNNKNISKFIKKKSPKLVFINGHGKFVTCKNI